MTQSAIRTALHVAKDITPVRRERPILDLPQDKNGMFIQPDILTPKIAVWVEHNRMRASKKYFYADTYCGDPKTVDPKKKYNCGGCNQADGDVCLLVEDDDKKRLPNGRYPPLQINRAKGSCGPYEIIDPDDPELRGNRLPKSIANYGVRKGGGPDEVFSCAECWKGIKSKWAILLGRGKWYPGSCGRSAKTYR